MLRAVVNGWRVIPLVINTVMFIKCRRTPGEESVSVLQNVRDIVPTPNWLTPLGILVRLYPQGILLSHLACSLFSDRRGAAVTFLRITNLEACSFSGLITTLSHLFSWFSCPFSTDISSSSSSCSWRVRRVSSSLILKMKLVPPSLPRSPYVPSSFLFIL